jgi:hypothetical protein
MSMYRAMQNPDTPDLPFAQSTMELATLTRSSNPTALSFHRPRPKTDVPKRAFKLKPQKTRSVDIVQLEKQRNTGLLALAGVLLLA